MVFWIVVVAVVAALLTPAWLYDRRYRGLRTSRRQPDVEGRLGRTAAQSGLERIRNITDDFH